MAVRRNLVGAATVPTQPLQTTPVIILNKLTNPFSTPLPVPKGGTGQGSVPLGGILYGHNGEFSILPLGTNGQVLVSDSTKPYWSNDLNDLNNVFTTLTS